MIPRYSLATSLQNTSWSCPLCAIVSKISTGLPTFPYVWCPLTLTLSCLAVHMPDQSP